MSAQESAAPPELTEVQKLRVQNAVQQAQLAELRAQLAQREFAASRDAALALLKQLEVAGYTLDLQTLTYTPVATAQETATK